MVRDIYDVTLKLKTPSDQGNSIDFTEKLGDLMDAVNVFNEKFRIWDKRIVIYMISKKSIHLLLAMEKEKLNETISARDIRFFTMYLNNKKNWHVFSRNTSNLFESVNFSRVDQETARDIVEWIAPGSEMYRAQLEDIGVFTNMLPGAMTMTDGSDVSDEEALAVIQYLMKTKDKGLRSHDKKATLAQINKLIQKWM